MYIQVCWKRILGRHSPLQLQLILGGGACLEKTCPVREAGLGETRECLFYLQTGPQKSLRARPLNQGAPMLSVGMTTLSVSLPPP